MSEHRVETDRDTTVTVRPTYEASVPNPVLAPVLFGLSNGGPFNFQDYWTPDEAEKVAEALLDVVREVRAREGQTS